MGTKWRQNVIVAALLVAAVLFLTINQRAIRQLEKEEEVDYNQLINMFKAKYGEERIIDSSICVLDGMCFNIYDQIDEKDKLTIVRDIRSNSLRMSSMYLKPPNVINSNSEDSTKWIVDKETPVLDSYTTTMIEELFLSGAAEMNRHTQVKVLVLGLGGGYLNTYLHHNYPRMDITIIELESQMLEISRKWFGLTLDERQRVIIKDGVHFVENAVAEGHKYDAILVDACVSDISQWLICPCETFVKPQMVENFAKLLSERGAFIVNVLSIRYDHHSVGKELRNRFRSTFNYCVLIQSHSQTNTVMTCTQHPRPKGLDRQYEVFAGYTKYGGKVSELIETW